MFVLCLNAALLLLRCAVVVNLEVWLTDVRLLLLDTLVLVLVLASLHGEEDSVDGLLH